MDIIRNVGIREPVCAQGSSKITDTDINSLAMKLADSKLNRNSLPNILFKDTAITSRTQRMSNGSSSTVPKARSTKANAVHVETNAVPHDGAAGNNANDDDHENDDDDDDGGEVECAVSGRLEIRVIQQSQEPPQKNSPIRDESIYFDAVANGQQNAVDDAKVSRKLANKMYTGHATIDHEVGALTAATMALTPPTTTTTTMQTADCGNCEQITDETAFYSVQTTGQKSADVTRLNFSNNSNPNSDVGGGGGGETNRAAGSNGTGLIANNFGITDNNSSMNDDNVADSFIIAGNALAKSSNVIGEQMKIVDIY